MGCCESTSATSSPPPKAPPEVGSKSPPPSCPYLQEETVKQVLPETTTTPRNGLLFNKPFPATHQLSEICATLPTPLPEKTRRTSPARSDRSPGRRTDPSPTRGRPGPGLGRRTDSGESSGRRSRSPVVRPDSGSWKTGLSGCKSDMSPARVRFGSSERIRKVEREKKQTEEITWPPTTSNELLENPHMSLECFIFL